MRAAVASGINEADPLSMLEFRDNWPDPIAPADHTLFASARPLSTCTICGRCAASAFVLISSRSCSVATLPDVRTLSRIIRRIHDRAEPQPGCEAGVHDDDRGRLHHRCVDDCVSNAVHSRTSRARRDRVDTRRRRRRGNCGGRAGARGRVTGRRHRSVCRQARAGVGRRCTRGGRDRSPSVCARRHRHRDSRPGSSIGRSPSSVSAAPVVSKQNSC